MKTLSDILRADPVWVNPTHRVASAIMLMRGHSVNGLPVLDGPKLVGMVLSEHLLGVDLRLPVNEVMDRHVVAVSPALSVREAAELMTRESLVRLPVVGQDGALLGVITNSDLLAELRRSTDPLTELPWSDSLQEWSVERLRSGQEITLLFLDIDCFGQFNKRFGHVVGDMVLKRVVGVLRQHLDSNQEILCRYGGDEFCISTLRTASMAEALGAALEKDIAGIRIQEARGEGVSVSVGIRGGRRTREREQVHYAATVNNLINLASQDCLAKKKSRLPEEKEADNSAPETAFTSEGVEAAPARQNDFDSDEGEVEGASPALCCGEAAQPPSSCEKRDMTLSLLEVNYSGAMANVRVVVENGRANGSPLQEQKSPEIPSYLMAELSRVVEPGEVPRLVAEATMSAVRRSLPAGWELRLKEVLIQNQDDMKLVTIVGYLITPQEVRPVAGSDFVGSDLYRTIAQSILTLTNLQIKRSVSAATE